MRRFLLVCCLALSACNSSTNPSDAKNQPFTLAPGQVVTTKVAKISIQFVSVPIDTRCPTDVTCILPGDATVRIQAQTPGSAVKSYDLHTNNTQPVTHDGATITLDQLMPAPISTKTIAPGDYRATLHVAE